MIEHIDARLNRWGEWARQGAGPRLDYPSESPSTRQRSTRGQPPDNPEAEQIDRILATLKPESRDLIMDWYFSRRNNSALMARYKLTRTQLYDTMDRIHHRIDGQLAGSGDA